MSKKCTPLWREAHFQVKMYKNTSASDDFWKLRCRKSARPCGAKHISKSKCTRNTPLSDHFWKLKHQGFGPLLEVRSSDVEKVHAIVAQSFEVKMFKTLGVRTTFGGSDVASLHYTTLHYTTLHYTTEHYTTPHPSTLHYTTLHSNTLHYTKLHYTTLHYTTLHYTEWHCTTDRQVDR